MPCPISILQELGFIFLVLLNCASLKQKFDLSNSTLLAVYFNIFFLVVLIVKNALESKYCATLSWGAWGLQKISSAAEYLELLELPKVGLFQILQLMSSCRSGRCRVKGLPLSPIIFLVLLKAPETSAEPRAASCAVPSASITLPAQLCCTWTWKTAD